MSIRLPLLLVLLLSLVLGPVKLSAACLFEAELDGCGGCCTEEAMSCCVTSGDQVPAKAPASVPPQAADAKPILPPTLVFISLCPLPAVERPSSYERQAARMPVTARLDLTCIRLI